MPGVSKRKIPWIRFVRIRQSDRRVFRFEKVLNLGNSEEGFGQAGHNSISAVDHLDLLKEE
jgi:hypothetical protein